LYQLYLTNKNQQAPVLKKTNEAKQDEAGKYLRRITAEE
jgi:hypothetical protein